MRSLYKPFLLVVLGLVSWGMPLGLPAQDTTRAKPNTTLIEFTCVAWEMPRYEALLYRHGKTYLPLVLRNGRRTLPLKIESTPSFEIYIPGIGKEGKPQYKKIGAAALPAGASKVMLMIDQRPTLAPDELPLSIVAVEDSFENFPLGSYRFINATEVTLNVGFSTTTRLIQPGKTEVIKHSSPKEAEYVPVAIALASNDQLVFQTSLYWEARGREVMVMLPPNEGMGSNKLRLRFVSDYVPPPSLEKKP